MKREKKKNDNKVAFLIVPAVVIILIGVILLVVMGTRNKDIKTNVVDTKNYSFEYDETWKIKEKSDNKALLTHSENAQIKIELSNVEEKHKYSELDDMIDEIIYNTNQNNSEYKLVKKEKKNLTNNGYYGYRILYENDANGVLINIIKSGGKLVTITYEAESDYFDILLDSANSIVSNFTIKEESLGKLADVNVETRGMEISETSELDSLLNDSKQYEIASNNYCVKYSIPTAFSEYGFDSKLGMYFLRDTEIGNASISTSIYTRNLYEAVLPESSGNIIKVSDEIKSSEEFEDSLVETENNGYNGYIYRNHYLTDSIIGKDEKILHENATLIYSLNANHIFIIKIECSNIEISQKLLDSIKIDSANNYASYIKQEKKDGYLIGKLKRYTTYEKDKIEEITLKIPEKYTEYDTDQNIYENRKYVLGFNEKLDEYSYEVTIKVSPLTEEGLVKSYNDSLTKSYGKITNMTKAGEKNINGKNFIEYNCGETLLSGIMYTDINRIEYFANKKVLIYQLSEKYNLVIEIKGNGKEITDDIVNEVTNFDIEIKEN